MDLLTKMVSLATAAGMILAGALEEAAPQHDAGGTLFLVNREQMVSDAFAPAELREAQVPGQVRQMRPEAAEALEEMFAACRAEAGVQLTSVSGYRDWVKQNRLYQSKLRQVH